MTNTNMPIQSFSDTGKIILPQQTHKFKPGDKVLVKFPLTNSRVKCEVLHDILCAVYKVKTTEAFSINGIWQDAGIEFDCNESILSLIEPEIKIGEHLVVNEPSKAGVQVGCTFVPDDTIKAIAKMRGIIKD